MARIMTKTGDKGTTGIFGGERVPKDDPRIEANGAMDELNANVGRRPGDGDGTSDGRNTRQWFLHPSWRDGSLG